MDAQSEAPARFVALDIRQHVALAGAVDAAGRVALPPQTIPIAELDAWLVRCV